MDHDDNIALEHNTNTRGRSASRPAGHLGAWDTQNKQSRTPPIPAPALPLPPQHYSQKASPARMVTRR